MKIEAYDKGFKKLRKIHQISFTDEGEILSVWVFRPELSVIDELIYPTDVHLTITQEDTDA